MLFVFLFFLFFLLTFPIISAFYAMLEHKIKLCSFAKIAFCSVCDNAWLGAGCVFSFLYGKSMQCFPASIRHIF